MAPDTDKDTGTASAYDVRYSTALISDANWAGAAVVSNPPVPKAAGLTESFVVVEVADVWKR